MKKSTFVIVLLTIVSSQLFSQIETLPRLGGLPTRVFSNSQSIGIGAGSIQQYFNVNGSKNIGIGEGISLSSTFYPTDGKLHIRHNSDLSNNTNTDGPQLILEETENDYSRLRFRQSSITGTFPSFSYTRGLRFWDVAGYANGNTESDDRFNIYHSVFGDLFTINGVGVTKLKWLEVDEFTKLGAGTDNVPIKTKLLTGTITSMPMTIPHGINPYYNILSTSIYIDLGGLLVPPNTNSSLGNYSYSINTNNVILSGSSLFSPLSYRIFITYTI